MKHYQTLKSAALAAFLMASSEMTAQAAITIETVSVGNVGNAADTVSPNPGYGAVAYSYDIGKYEVTNTQYAAFLNAKAATDTFDLYNTNMGSSLHGGITQIGSSGSYTYATKTGFEIKPVNFVSFWDAARFTNWLSNGQGTGSTETGSYELGSVTNPNNVSITRSVGATWAVASEDEWYKAAYYDPNKVSLGAGGYWLYPTKSSTISSLDANYSGGTVTNVGTYSNDSSYYGTYDQGGNVQEWNDKISGGLDRGLRGGTWTANGDYLKSSSRITTDARGQVNDYGFRVVNLAAIPEPSVYGAVMGVMTLGVVMMRRRKARGTL